jgi:cysteine-rich repeat protein
MVTWSDGGPSNTPGYSSVFLQNVDQADPIGASDTANCDCEILSTVALATNASDMVMLAASHGGNSASSTDYACLNGFTEALEFYDPPNSGEGMGGYKAATGADETPSVDSQNNNYSGRQALLGFVVQVEAGGDCGDSMQDPGEDCDDGNTLDGDCCSSICEYESAATVCRAAAGTCDAPDHCDGAGTCDPDAKLTSECRASAGACDIADNCDGVNDTCPPDAVEPVTAECRADAGECDIAENCDGASAPCPPDAKLTIECRASTGVCDAADFCDGVSDNCGLDLPANGAPCPDGNLCNGDEICVGFTCTDRPPLDCDDDDICTEDSCDALLGCIYVPCAPMGSDCRRPDLPSASPTGRLLLSLLVVGAGATFLARRRRFGA